MWSFKNWRRGRVLERDMLDSVLWEETVEELPFLAVLSQDERERLRQRVILFLHEKNINGAGGLQLTDAMRVSIAAQACLPILNLDLDYYRDWAEVIVYPDEFVVEYDYTDEDGVVHQVQEPRAGESWLQGPVILSWADVAEAGEGYNVVLHEFAHKLDMLNGDASGFPPLHAGMSREAWSSAFGAAYAEFCRQTDEGEETLLDPYAAEHPAEFFAVMSEAFFVMPQEVLLEYPAVYRQLAQFYRQDPALRESRAGFAEARA